MAGLDEAIDLADEITNSEEFTEPLDNVTEEQQNLENATRTQEIDQEQITEKQQTINKSSGEGIETATEKINGGKDGINSEKMSNLEEKGRNGNPDEVTDAMNDVLDSNTPTDKANQNVENLNKASQKNFDNQNEGTSNAEQTKSDMEKAQKEINDEYKDWEENYVKKDKNGNWKNIKKSGAKPLQDLLEKARSKGVDILRKNPELEENLTAKSKSGKSGATWKTVLKVIAGIIAVGGMAAMAIKVSLMAAALTGCYKYGPTIKDQEGPLDLPLWQKKGFKHSSNDVAANCGCSNVTGGGCDGVTSKIPPIPSKTECCDKTKGIGLLPFCASGSPCDTSDLSQGGQGCNSEYPGCYGTEGDPNNNFIAYGFQHVSALSLLSDFLAGAANAGAGIPGAIKKIITYIAVGVGVILLGYAIFAIIRSFSNRSGGSSGGKTEVVEVKK